MLQRRDGIDVGIHARRGLELRVGQPARNTHHLHHILHTFLTQRIGVWSFVRQSQFLIETIEVADKGVDIHRFHRIADREMDAVEILGKLKELLISFKIGG